MRYIVCRTTRTADVEASWQPLERRLAGMTFFDMVALANQWGGSVRMCSGEPFAVGSSLRMLPHVNGDTRS